MPQGFPDAVLVIEATSIKEFAADYFRATGGNILLDDLSERCGILGFIKLFARARFHPARQAFSFVSAGLLSADSTATGPNASAGSTCRAIQPRTRASPFNQRPKRESRKECVLFEIHNCRTASAHRGNQ